VTFESEIGRFDNTSAQTTDEEGEASKSLTVTPADIDSSLQTFRVTVRTPSSSGTSFLEGSTDVRITRPNSP
jgi:hypothetical protein